MSEINNGSVIGDILGNFKSLHIDLKDLSGKTALITGGNDGIGLYTAVLIAKMKCKVIIASRNVSKSLEAVEKIKQLSGNDDVASKALDLGSIANVKQFVKEFTDEYNSLDILINNAAATFYSFAETNDGLERMFQVNHLGHFILTLGLVPLLERSGAGRIVNTSSDAHKWITLVEPLDISVNRSEFDYMNQYIKTKMYNLLFTKILSEKLSSRKITVVGVNPGFVKSNSSFANLPNTITMKLFGATFWFLQVLLARKGEQGGVSTAYAATSDDVVNGGYYDSCKPRRVSDQAKSDPLAQQLWNLSLELGQVTFD